VQPSPLAMSESARPLTHSSTTSVQISSAELSSNSSPQPTKKRRRGAVDQALIIASEPQTPTHAVLVIWSEQFRLHRTPEWHAEQPARIDWIMKTVNELAAKYSSFVKLLDDFSPIAIDAAALLETHDAAYLRRMRDRCPTTDQPLHATWRSSSQTHASSSLPATVSEFVVPDASSASTASQASTHPLRSASAQARPVPAVVVMLPSLRASSTDGNAMSSSSTSAAIASAPASSTREFSVSGCFDGRSSSVPSTPQMGAHDAEAADTFMSRDSWHCALLAAGAAVRACDAAMSADGPRRAFCVVRPVGYCSRRVAF
jgi:acetoin utilization deacetylase AcuC-like enzyme